MVDNDRLFEKLTENHEETIQRLTKLETQLQGVPERVTQLESKYTLLKGVGMAVSFIFSSALAYIEAKH